MLIDKPSGPTSHDVVARVRKALGIRRVGHTGTLDPFASGLMVILLERATRLARFVEGREKTYLATARLGVATDTDDLTGAVTGGSVREVDDDELTAALAGLVGVQRQRPPAYSAKHVDGRRSYQLARRGLSVELPEVEVEVYGLDLLHREGDTVTFRARVGSGTYIRAIARDLGTNLGTGGHLTALRRERIGDLDVGDAVALEDVSRATPLLPAASVVRHLPMVSLEEPAARAVRHGQLIPWPDVRAPAVALFTEGRLIGIAEADGAVLRPSVVLEDPA